jgi:hypothetical protein
MDSEQNSQPKERQGNSDSDDVTVFNSDPFHFNIQDHTSTKTNAFPFLLSFTNTGYNMLYY